MRIRSSSSSLSSGLIFGSGICPVLYRCHYPILSETTSFRTKQDIKKGRRETAFFKVALLTKKRSGCLVGKGAGHVA